MKITIIAPAKVNLWLRVGPKRPDGFHEIDTAFCALDLADDVEVRRGDEGSGVTLEVAHAPPLRRVPDLGPDERNLATRAAIAFAERAGIPADFRIRLLKRIPTGAGLGGGSSDAAGVLRALHLLLPRALEPEVRQELAAELGSDVAFFLHARPLAHATGRGEQVVPQETLPPRPVVLVLPPFGVSTASAYGWLDQAREEGDVPQAAALSPGAGEGGAGTLAWDQVARLAVNDFEPVVFPRHPTLPEARDMLRAAGAEIALLAGSGSTVFGVFREDTAAEDAARRLRAHEPPLRVVVTRTRSR